MQDKCKYTQQGKKILFWGGKLDLWLRDSKSDLEQFSCCWIQPPILQPQVQCVALDCCATWLLLQTYTMRGICVQWWCLSQLSVTVWTEAEQRACVYTVMNNSMLINICRRAVVHELVDICQEQHGLPPISKCIWEYHGKRCDDCCSALGLQHWNYIC